MANGLSTEDIENLLKEGISITDVNVNKNGLALTGTAFSSPLEKQKYAIYSAKLTQQQLQKIISMNSGAPWPQTQLNPEFSSTTGFLPSVLLQPTLQSNPVSSQFSAGRDATGDVKVTQTYANYKFVDWRGQQLSFPPKSLTTEDRFYAGRDLPRNAPVLVDKPYSMRDVPLIFGDGRMDYFKHGLQVLGDGNSVSNLTPIDNPASGASTQRLQNFKETPWENEDPPMFGFDIIFDSYSSPLLNGSLTDFILNYSNVSEIASKRQVYEEFKNQFQKFFRINGEMKVDPNYIAMTSLYNKIAGADSPSSIHNPHKKNYLGHYVKKVSGLDFLLEQNKGDTIKYTPDYKKDFITLQLREDVSMNMGVLAHLYKTLYWSKPNGKMLIPENLLRFNCIIIISECRNFQRVKKGIKNPDNINIIKDNLSRYVYTLRECQFYFDKLPLNNEVDLGDQGPSIYETYEINFDFKYSSVKLERFVPNGDWGNYVGIDGGSIWKVGNKGTRNSRGTTGSQELSTPRFFTVGPDNETYTYYPNLKINGEEKPYIMTVYGPQAAQPDEFNTAQKKSSEGTVGGNNEGTGGQNVGELGAGNDGNNNQKTMSPALGGGEGTPGGGTSPTEGSGSAPSLDALKSQSQQNVENNKQQAEITAVQDAVSSQKKMSFGSVNAALSDVSLNKITKTVATPLNQVVANKSISSDIVSGKFFDKMGSLKIEDSLKSIKTGGISNLTEGLGGLKGTLSGGLSGGLSGLKSAVPSLDSVKTKFSEAKSKATSGFFDIRGNLKSSLTEGAGLKGKASSLLGGLSGNAEGLLGGLTEQASGLFGGLKSKVPSLDSVKTKFSAAKSQATSGFFDIRGNLKSSLTEGASGLKTKATGLFGGLSNQSGGLLGGLTDKVKSAVPSLDSVKTKFSAAKSQASTGFFDIRGNLKSSLTEGASGLKNKATGLFGGLSSQADGLLGGLTDKVKSAVPSLDSVKTKFSAAKSQATSGFFDIRGNLKSSLTDGAEKLSGGGLFSGLSKQADGLLGGLTSKVTSAVPSLDSVKTKFSSAISQPTTGFFDIRGNLKSSLTEGSNKIMTSFTQAVDDANSLTSQVSKKKNDTINLVKGLLNQEVEDSKNTIGKFVSVDNLKEKFTSATEIPSSSFFDVRGQISGQKGSDTSSLNLRKNLLNNTIDKIYNTQKSGSSPVKSNTPPATSFFDLKNQLKDFLGGSLGDKLTE